MNMNRRLYAYVLFSTLLGLLLFSSAVRSYVPIAYTRADNSTPRVEAGDDQTVLAGEKVLFSGSFSDPNTADPHVIRWDFGDGCQIWGTLTPTHSFPNSGQYTVTLTVTDDDGAAGSDSLLVDVLNRPPKLSNITVNPREINEGDRFILSGMMSDTADDSAYSLEIDWGDGLTVTRNYPAGTLSFSFNHTNIDDLPSGTAADSVTLNLKLTDDEGASSAATAEIRVNNVAPSVNIGSDRRISTGKPIELTAVVTDPGSADTFSITWDFGDGSPPQAGVTAAHIFAKSGTYNVTATVTDDDGGIGQATIKVDASLISYLPLIIRD